MEEHAVINPVSRKGSPVTGQIAVMAATLPDVVALTGTLKITDQKYRNFYSARLYQNTINGRNFCLVGPFIGAPHAVLLLENLIASGVDTVIFSGWCGSLSGTLEIGNRLLPSGAFPDEGTSRHYGISSGDMVIHTDSGLNDVITSILVEKNIGFKTGPVWTTDAIYRETPSKIKHYGSMGALAVEMELSALLSVAAFRGIRLSSLLTVSDEIGSLNWKPGFSDPRFKAGRASMAAAIGDVVERILNG